MDSLNYNDTDNSSRFYEQEEPKMAMKEVPISSTNDLQAKPVRNATFSMCEALAIICVVLSHSGGPSWLLNIVFQFHVPVFLICAGYFFNTKYLNDEKTYIANRIKGLYFPFVRWSIFFLVFHNLWFYLGILNEQYGNAGGGVTHPYNFSQFSQRLWSIVFNMSGYDEFLAGAFWFFRALFIGSIAFLLLYKICVWLLIKNGKEPSKLFIGGIIFVISLLMSTWLILANLKITGISQGGYREIMVVCFMAIGYIFRQIIDNKLFNKIQKERFGTILKICLPSFLLLIFGSIFFPSSMTYRPDFWGSISLPFTGFAGFLLLYFFSIWLQKQENILKQLLIYIGDNTLYIFAFHLLAFKLVSIFKVVILNLPWKMVGGHPIVIEGSGHDFFWLIYLLVGICAPLVWIWVYRKLEYKLGFTLAYDNLLNQKVINLVFSNAFNGLYFITFKSLHLLRALCMSVWHFFSNLVQGIKDIIKASSPEDE